MLPVATPSTTHLALYDSTSALPSSSRPVSYKRLALVSAPAALSLTGVYIYLQNVWWAGDKVPFHFDDGHDLRYALNLDKFAHFYGGAITAAPAYEALRWARVDETTARWGGAAFGSLGQLLIEIKDGFAPFYGFSPWDVGIGMLGSLYPVAQHHSELLADTHLKFGYLDRSSTYEDHFDHPTWINDYIDQTYWLSHRVNDRLPASVAAYWPDWLALAAGVSVDATGGDGSPNVIELYLSPDVDLTRLFPTDDPLWRRVVYYLNFFKLPTPALRLTPSAQLRPFYF